MSIDPATSTALSALVVGDALGQVAMPAQLAVLTLMLATAGWARSRRTLISLVAFVACALVWSRANQRLEGQILITFTPDHGLTTADLLAPTLTALVLARTAGRRSAEQARVYLRHG